MCKDLNTSTTNIDVEDHLVKGASDPLQLIEQVIKLLASIGLNMLYAPNTIFLLERGNFSPILYPILRLHSGNLNLIRFAILRAPSGDHSLIRLAILRLPLEFQGSERQ